MDIDIDFADRHSVLEIIQHIPASLDGNKRHNTGVYCHEIPVNPLTGLASIDYKTAESRGYFKLDFLNVNIYRDVKDNAHLEQLMNTEPLWDLLEQDEFVNLLFHINGHGNLLRQTRPCTIEQLAAVLAMIRPAKRYLAGQDWDTILKEVWVKPTGDEYYFKKSHALSYAMAVIVHMNLICESIIHEYS
jgi:hypothetical protein